jgi:hypothetical protein
MRCLILFPSSSSWSLAAGRSGGGLYDEEYVQKRMDRAYEVEELGANLTKKMHPSGRDDISVLAMQRLFNQYAFRCLLNLCVLMLRAC